MLFCVNGLDAGVSACSLCQLAFVVVKSLETPSTIAPVHEGGKSCVYLVSARRLRNIETSISAQCKDLSNEDHGDVRY